MTEDWRRRAVCRGVDPELFYPFESRTGRMDPAEQAKADAARAICGRCPVRSACVAEAHALRDPWGIWGGLTDRDRRLARGEIRTTCGRTGCGTPLREGQRRYCCNTCKTAAARVAAAATYRARREATGRPPRRRRDESIDPPALVAEVIHGERRASDLTGPQRATIVAELTGRPDWCTERIAAALGILPRSVLRIRSRVRALAESEAS